jgi:nucleotide-binding universal stress UspA family protein
MGAIPRGTPSAVQDREEIAMFTRILVPTDFSAPSDAALLHARGLAEHAGAALHVLHLVDNMFLRAVLQDPCDHEAAARRQLEDRLTADGVTALAVVAQSDRPADEIVTYARLHDIDLIVMGTHGRSGIAHLLLGSVAERVVHTAPCPVLTLRATPPPAIDSVRILVPTDFSPSADRALADAHRLAAVLGASVRLLHVVDDLASQPKFGSELALPLVPGLREEQAREARERLERRVAIDARYGGRPSTEVMFGPTARTIVAYAAACEFDIIVMGTHGRAGLAGRLIGSVADSVIRKAPCPVLTVRGVAEERAETGARGLAAAAAPDAYCARPA